MFINALKISLIENKTYFLHFILHNSLTINNFFNLPLRINKKNNKGPTNLVQVRKSQSETCLLHCALFLADCQVLFKLPTSCGLRCWGNNKSYV